MSDAPQITELGHNTLLVNHAGYGVTPPCPTAKFRISQVLKARGRKEFCAVVAVVPPGFPAEYALADVKKEPRPLMITKERRCVTYIVGFVDDPVPYLYPERSLRATDQPDTPVEWMKP